MAFRKRQPKTRTVNRIAKTGTKRIRRSPAAAFGRLVKIMARLRSPDGCPWDRKQTHRSLIPYLVEETFELKDALLSKQPERMREELGDLLLQIVFHAQLASERGRFDAADVAEGIADKLVRRHPHVFRTRGSTITAEQVLKNWERIKLSEQSKSSASVLQGLPRSMPALLRAYRVQEKVAQYGFDWNRTEEVEAKLEEEVQEFHTALTRGDQKAATEELGDLLFTLVNLARHMGVDPETALDATTAKFAGRFERVERNLKRRGIDPGRAGLDVLEAEWQAVKQATMGTEHVRRGRRRQ